MLHSKQDFIDWKENSVTQDVFAALRDSIEKAKDYLCTSIDENEANRVRGLIQGLRDVLEIDIEVDEGAPR